MKLYIQIPSTKGEFKDGQFYQNPFHQMIRVDSLKEFREVCFGQATKLHFESLMSKIKLGLEVVVKPFEIEVTEQEFEAMEKAVRSKVSSVIKPRFKAFNLVQDSKHNPMIRVIPPKVFVDDMIEEEMSGKDIDLPEECLFK